MPIQQLSKSSALSSGTNLWVLPELNQSTWARQVDWYLNLQMWRSEYHKVPSFSMELNTWLQDNEIKPLQIKTSTSAPLMIASQGHLPAAEIVMLPCKNLTEVAWLEAIHQLWLQMNKPSLRIFLPNHIKTEIVHQVWAKDTDSNIGIVRGEA